MQITIKMEPEDYTSLFKAMSDPEVVKLAAQVMPTLMEQGAKSVAEMDPELRDSMMKIMQDAWAKAAETAMRQQMENMAKVNPMAAMFLSMMPGGTQKE